MKYIVREGDKSHAHGSIEISDDLVRDLFAAVIVAAASGLNNWQSSDKQAAAIAAQAYDLADAMMFARERDKELRSV